MGFVGALACAAALAGVGDARADGLDPLQAVVSAGAPPSAAAVSPATMYAALDRDACEAELGKRNVPFTRVDAARGVLAPVRLTGALHGVTFRTALPASKRASSPWEIVDCRLALALDDFAVQLEKHDVAEVIHYSIYRPPSKRWPGAKIASRHPGGLAIDAGTFVKKDGTRLEVERDFHGHIGAPTCGTSGATPQPSTPEALELRHIVCDAADAHLFNVELTPDYNWAHRNHFHLEVTAGAKWFLVH